MKAPVEVSTPEVARLVGLTTRQLQHWANRGLAHADAWPGSGVHRHWTVPAIRHAAVMGQLVNDLGMTPRRASQVADEALANVGERWTADVGDITLSGWWPWVPEPQEDET